MEYIGIEKEAVQAVQKKVERLNEAMLGKAIKPDRSLTDWIENTELSEQLGLSLRTLHNYRLSGVLPFSNIGRKIYYKRKDIQEFLNLKRVPIKCEVKSQKSY